MEKGRADTQITMINNFIARKQVVSIRFVNGNPVKGIIVEQDKYTVVFCPNGSNENLLIYKHGIVSIGLPIRLQPGMKNSAVEQNQQRQPASQTTPEGQLKKETGAAGVKTPTRNPQRVFEQHK